MLYLKGRMIFNWSAPFMQRKGIDIWSSMYSFKRHLIRKSLQKHTTRYVVYIHMYPFFQTSIENTTHQECNQLGVSFCKKGPSIKVHNKQLLALKILNSLYLIQNNLTFSLYNFFYCITIKASPAIQDLNLFNYTRKSKFINIKYLQVTGITPCS